MCGFLSHANYSFFFLDHFTPSPTSGRVSAMRCFCRTPVPTLAGVMTGFSTSLTGCRPFFSIAAASDLTFFAVFALVFLVDLLVFVPVLLRLFFLHRYNSLHGIDDLVKC